MRVLLTRPRQQAEATAARLRELGHEPILAPLLSIRPSCERPPAGPYDALIVTSANAVPALEPFETKTRVFAVGTRTADAARSSGFREVFAAEGDAASLSSLIVRSLSSGARLLHLAGRDHKAEPRASLLAAGFAVETFIAYEAQPATALPHELRDAMLGEGIDAALHYSRRTVEAAIALCAAAGLIDRFLALRHACLAEDVALPLRERGVRRLILARAPEEASLLSALALCE
jgi:uroporphyrinogen-III synthase